MKTAAFSAAELRLEAGYPGGRICRTFTRKGAAVSSQGLPEIAGPLGGRPKADHAAGSFARRSGKADCPARTSSRRSAKADRAARTSSRRSAKADCAARSLPRRSAKADAPPGLLHGEARKPTARPEFATAKRESRLRWSPLPGRGFSGRAAGRNGALPYNARKSQFLRNGDVWATESLFLFAVLWLAFLPDQSETGVAGGGKARRSETPAAPRRPAQRPRPAPGFCAASANARPGDSAPVRLLEKALWAPPTTEPFRPAPSGKPERERKTKGGTPDETRTAALTTAPPEDGWEGSQPKRPQRRGKPAKRPRRSAS